MAERDHIGYEETYRVSTAAALWLSFAWGPEIKKIHVKSFSSFLHTKRYAFYLGKEDFHLSKINFILKGRSFRYYL